MQVYSVIYITLFVGWVDLETSYVAVISLRISSFSKLEARTYTVVSPSIDVWLCWMVALDENNASVMCHITTSTSNPRYIDQSSLATGISLMPPEATAEITWDERTFTLWLHQFHSFLSQQWRSLQSVTSGRCCGFLGSLAVMTSVIWEEWSVIRSRELGYWNNRFFPWFSEEITSQLKINCIPLIFCWIVLTCFFLTFVVQLENKTKKKTSCSLVKVPMEAGPVRGFLTSMQLLGEIPTTFCLDFEALGARRLAKSYVWSDFEASYCRRIASLGKKGACSSFDKGKFFLYIPSPFPVFDPSRMLPVGETAKLYLGEVSSFKKDRWINLLDVVEHERW